MFSLIVYWFVILSNYFFSIAELLLHTLQLPVGHPDQPFSIRLLSFDNLLAAPIDCYCPITTVVARDQKEDGYKNDNSGAEHGVQKVVFTVFYFCQRVARML